jgi:hypothetical protein
LIWWLDVCICSTWMELEWINNYGGLELREPARTGQYDTIIFSIPDLALSKIDWLLLCFPHDYGCVWIDGWQGWLGCIHVFRDMAIKVVCLMIGWANFLLAPRVSNARSLNHHLESFAYKLFFISFHFPTVSLYLIYPLESYSRFLSLSSTKSGIEVGYSWINI